MDVREIEKIMASLDRQVFRTWARLSQDFERELFVFMKEKHTSKVYVVREFSVDGNNARLGFYCTTERPEGETCEMHDYTKLLKMSDKEFNELPYTTNKIFVKEWRDEMRKEEK